MKSPDHTTQGTILEALWRRTKEIRALCGLAPLSLTDSGGTAGPPRSLSGLVEILLQDLETNFRRELATRVQLEGLGELVAFAARESGPEKPYLTLIAYLARALDEPRLWLGVLRGDPPAFSLFVAQDRGESSGLAERVPLSELDPAWLRWLALGTGDSPIATDPIGIERAGPWHVSAIHGNMPPGRLGGAQAACPGTLPGRGACSLSGEPLSEMAGGAPACGRCEFRRVIGLVGVAGEAASAGRRASLTAIVPSLGSLLANLNLNEALDLEARFRDEVIERLPLGVVAVDLEGRVLTWNRFAEDILGTAREEAMSGTLDGVPGAEPWRAALLDCLSGASPRAPFECPITRPDGSTVPVEVRVAALRDAKESTRGCVVTLDDLSSLRTMEERIRQLDRLAALGRFASSVAHEIRNPLTGIATGVQYLSRAFPEGDPQQEDVQFILREVTRLNTIIQDLLSATRARNLTLGPVSVADAASRALKNLGPDVEGGGVEIKLEGADHWPRALADLDQLQQVILNLFQNAIQAMPDGGVLTMRVRATGDAHAPRISIEIEDTGKGIPAENLPRLFEPFFTTRPKGTGLGLFVAHGIVQRHGGSIDVRSGPESGTRFVITLPGIAA